MKVIFKKVKRNRDIAEKKNMGMEGILEKGEHNE